MTEWGWLTAFDGSDSFDDTGVATYAWDFGDGTTGHGSNPTHIYWTEGNYTATLVVYDSTNQPSDPATISVQVVTSTPPLAEAGGPYTGGANGTPVYFNAAGSSDAGAAGVQQGIVQYLWDVDIATDSSGDSIPDNDVDITGFRPWYVYPTAGTYTAQLTVIDGPGQSDTDTATVTIGAEPHRVLCVLWRGSQELPHPAISGQAVRLKGTVVGNGPFTYQWDFGDGSDPYPASPGAVSNTLRIEATHTYTGDVGKPFTARLTVWDGAGNPVSDNYQIRLEPDTLSTRSDIAVDNGLWYLHHHQNKSSGAWTGTYSSYYHASTSSALQAFQVNGHRLNGNAMEDPYVDTVTRGYGYLFTRLRGEAISNQTHGNPDSNGNGIGVDVDTNDEPYLLGQVIDALVSSQDPFATAWAGPNNIKGRTFHELVTDMVDMYAFGQAESGGRGGWRYGWNYSSSDNSAAQWGAIGLIAA